MASNSRGMRQILDQQISKSNGTTEENFSANSRFQWRGSEEIVSRHEAGHYEGFHQDILDRQGRDVYMSGRLDKRSSDGNLDSGSPKRSASLLPDSTVLAPANSRRGARGRLSDAFRAGNRNAAWC